MNPSFGLLRRAALSLGFATAALAMTSGANAASGDVDLTFDPPLSGSDGSGSAALNCVIMLPEGGFITGGYSSYVGATPRGPLVRFNYDGTLDTAFAPVFTGGSFGSHVYCAAVLPDGKILEGGNFSVINGQGTGGFVRLNADGTVDTSFIHGTTAKVERILVQPDGKILVSTDVSTNSVIRLHPNGSRDISFTPSSGVSWLNGRLLALQPDGKILITADGNGYTRWLARLNTSGSTDTGFLPDVHDVYSCTLDASGRMIITGDFLTVRGVPRNRIARILTDGSLDTAFHADFGPSTGTPGTQADGKIIFGGKFSTINGAERNSFVRLLPDGSIDVNFHARGDSPNESIPFMTFQPDGRIIAGGSGKPRVNGVERRCLVRLLNDPVTREVAVSPGGVFMWMRGGAATEVQDVTIRLSTDGGNTWTTGVATRIPGGWQKTGLPASGEIQAFARYPGTSPGLEMVETTFGGVAPVLALEEPAGTPLPGTGAAVSFGDVLSGDATVKKTFTIRNTGSAMLRLAGASLTGLSGTEFSINTTGMTTRLPAGASTSFSVTCGSSGYGAAFATLRIIPDTAGVPVFSVALSANILPNADLSELSLNFVSTITPAFSSAITAYRTILPNQVTGAYVTATRAHSKATLSLHGQPLTSGTARHILLEVGDNVLPIIVTASDGTTTKTYTLTITRSEPSAALRTLRFSAGLLVPRFTPPLTAYGMTVGFPVSSVTVDPEAEEYTATVKVNGIAPGPVVAGVTLPLVEGSNPILVDVISTDGSVRCTYTIEIVRRHPGPNDPEPSWAKLTSDQVLCSAMQPDGKTLVGGHFGTIYRHHIDGTRDWAFGPSVNGSAGVFTLTVQDDGKIIVGGPFQTSARNYLMRLSSGGVLDATFAPAPNSTVRCVALQADGSILIGGGFSMVGAVPRNRLARLDASGALDTGFNPNFNGMVRSLAVQPDGRILAGGQFTSVGGGSHRFLVRLLPNGTVDTSFNPAPDDWVRTITVLPDSRIFAGGDFLTMGGHPNSRLARLNPDGTSDATWESNAGGADGVVYATALQTDGRMLVAGNFANMHGADRNLLARLLPNGLLDTAFDPRISGSVVDTVTLQGDGRIVAGGILNYVDGVRTGGTVRLGNDRATQNLTVSEGSLIRWLRGGSVPEAERVTFDLSTNGGIAWTPLGAAGRISGGWELSGLTLPAGGHIRARARVSTGIYNSSSSLLETIVPFPLTPLEFWRQVQFNTVANTGIAADHFDADGDGLVNLLEFAFGLNPRVTDADQFPRPSLAGGEMSFEFSRPIEADGMNYAAEWSPSLAAGSWQPVPETRIGRNLKFSIPVTEGGKGFVRITVGVP